MASTFSQSGLGITPTEVEQALRKALELRDWWVPKEANRNFQRSYPLVHAYNESETSYGFSDTATIDGKEIPIIGEVEDLYFDAPKDGNVHTYRRNLREFVLGYLLRVSDFQRPTTSVPCEIDNGPFWNLFSFCPEDDRRTQASDMPTTRTVFRTAPTVSFLKSNSFGFQMCVRLERNTTGSCFA